MTNNEPKEVITTVSYGLKTFEGEKVRLEWEEYLAWLFSIN